MVDRGIAPEQSLSILDPSRGRRPAQASGRLPEGWDALTVIEMAVVRAVERGLTNAEVAEALHLSVNTIKTHLKRIFRKLSVRTRSELAALAATDTALTTRHLGQD